MTNYFSGFYPLETSSGSKGSAAFLGAISTAIVYLYRRSSTALTNSDKPNGNVIYTFSNTTANITAVTNGWSTTVPSGTDPLYVVSATASSIEVSDTILTVEWSTPVILVQNGTNGANGTNGTPAISGFVTNDSISLTAYADGNIISYSTATGEFKINSGNTDVSSSFTLSTISNPQALTVGYVNRTYSITGGFDSAEDNATLTIRATGSGSYAGITIDKVIALSKSKGGYEIVATLPVSNLFEGRIVYRTSDGLLYKYKSGNWTSLTDATEITGLVKSSQIDAGYGQNLVTNPRGQDGTAGWALTDSTNLGTYQFTQNTFWFGSGRFGFNIENKSSINVGVAIGCRAFPVVPGRTYSIRFRHGSSGTTAGNFVRIFHSGTQPSSGFITVGTRTGFTPVVAENVAFPGSEIEIVTSWKAPTGVNWASINFYNWASTGVINYYFSEVEIVEQAITSKLPMGVGANLLTGAVPGTNPQRYINPVWNPDTGVFLNMVTGAFESNPVSRQIIGDPVAGWIDPGSMGEMPDKSNFVIKQTGNGTPNFNVTDFVFDRVVNTSGNTEEKIPIEPGKSYEGSLWVGPHRCKAWLFILWYDSNLNQISPTEITESGLAFIDQSTQGSMGGAQLSNYTRLIARGSAPSNARFAVLVLRKGSTAVGASPNNSYLFGTRPMLAETTSNASQALPYSPPPPALFHAESIISNTIDTRHLRANSIKSDTIDAGAVIASKIAIGEFDNLIPNGNFSSGNTAGWTRTILNAPGSSISVQGPSSTWPSAYGLKMERPLGVSGEISITSGNTSFDDTTMKEGIDLQPGDELWFEGYTYTTNTNTNIFVDCLLRYSSTAIAVLPATAISGCIGGSGLSAAPGPNFTRFSGYFKNTLTQAGKAYIRVLHASTSGQDVWLWNAKARRRSKGELIVDGSIVTDKLSAGAVTASKIAVTDLSAITANVGVLTAGTIRNAADTYNMDVTNGRTVARTGSWMKVTGAPFGSTNQFIEWYGPYSTNLATCTEANAVYYLKTDGSAYFGGTLSAGTLKNSAATTVVSPSALIEIGPFGSNGNPRNVVVSLSYENTYTISNTVSYSGSTTATVVIDRWNGSSWVQIGTTNMVGSVITQYDGFGTSEPGIIRINMGGSLTVTDTSGGTSGIRMRARITAWSQHSITSTVMNQITTQNLSIISTEG